MANTFGSTFGGMARAADRRRRSDMIGRGLDLRERQLNNTQARADEAAIRENFSQLTGIAADMRKAGVDINDPAIQAFRNRIATTAEAAGMDPAAQVSIFDGVLRGVQTPEQAASSQARSEVAGAATTAELLDVPVEDVARAKNLIPEQTIQSVLDMEDSTIRFVTTADVLADPERFRPTPETGAENAKEQTIGRILESFAAQGTPISRAQAIQLVDGVLRLSENPVTGTRVLVNMIDGTEMPLRSVLPGDPGTPEATATTPATEERETLTDVARRGNVAGIVPSVQEAGSAVTGQVPGGAVAEQTIEDRQAFRTAQNDIIRALSINPRFPVAEMERIRRETAIEPSMWDSTGSLLSRMRSIQNSMEGRLQAELAAGNNQNLPVEARQNARQAANDIQRFLTVLGDVTATQPTNLSDEDLDLIQRNLNREAAP